MKDIRYAIQYKTLDDVSTIEYRTTKELILELKEYLQSCGCWDFEIRQY